ncbi:MULTISPECIES: patatin-like phospholipase family protein [unclassified Sphingobacterium]|uniref:patatin-like phospholipase family protein n=1 Tax=unclassified Sphingobacterium TaxID=2609468 RepID=UPI0025D2765F|nr:MULTISPECIES: patatin-like phospholipase family protein [unclassified Sphingobacterium]
MHYQRAVLFSGGGTRFGLYLGMYAALGELGLKPDLLIATCGGSLAAAIIQAFERDAERKSYLQSEEFYRFFCGHQLTEQRHLGKLGLYVLKKQWDKRSAPYLEDVFDRYLVKMEHDLSPLLPTLNRPFSQEIPSIIIGSRMLFDRSEVGERRGERKLYQKVLMGNATALSNVNLDGIQLQGVNYAQSAVAPTTVINRTVTLLEAVRISMSDMFYIEPIERNGEYYAGGAIDLVPVELAQSLATEVIGERKQLYKLQEEGLVRAVLGFSGNQRLRDINQQFREIRWIDTRDAAEQLVGSYCRKGIDWRKFEITLSLPTSLDEFAAAMETQWNYGYSKTMELGMG